MKTHMQPPITVAGEYIYIHINKVSKKGWWSMLQWNPFRWCTPGEPPISLGIYGCMMLYERGARLGSNSMVVPCCTRSLGGLCWFVTHLFLWVFNNVGKPIINHLPNYHKQLFMRLFYHVLHTLNKDQDKKETHIFGTPKSARLHPTTAAHALLRAEDLDPMDLSRQLSTDLYGTSTSRLHFSNLLKFLEVLNGFS